MTLLSGKLILGTVAAVGAIAVPPAGASFVDVCAQRNSLSAPAGHTVAQLLAVAATEDCQTAIAVLAEMTTLDLTGREITDLSPLTTLPHLETLYLGQNQISDIQPLAALTNLQHLYLLDNQVANLTPIAQLNQLETLSIDGNEISDLSPLVAVRSLNKLFASNNQLQTIEPLAQLPNLTELTLAANQIETVAPIAELDQLTVLNLGNNRINDIADLAKLSRLVELDLSENRLTQIGELEPLSALTQLDLRNNPIARKTCPVFPATICIFSDGAAELFRQGETELAEGEYTAALATFEMALEQYRTESDRLRESDALDRLGNGYDVLGQYANSLTVYQEAATLRETLGDRQGTSESLTNLGVTYLRLGQLQRAIQTLEEALAVHQSLTPRDSSWLRPEPREGRILGSLALAYGLADQTESALEFAKRSLAAFRKGNDRPGEAIALTQVGDAYLKLGDLDKARVYFDKALELSEREGDRPGKARSLKALGDFAAGQGATTTALERYQIALTIYRELGDVAGEGETLNAIGELLLKTDQPKAAAEALSQTISLWESLRPGLTDANKISIAETQAKSYQLLQRSLIQLNEVEAALEISERGRARAFAELLAHRLSLQGQTIPPERVQPPTVDQIRQVAQTQNATLVEYAIVGDDLYIWVVQPSGEIHFVQQSLAEKTITAWVTENRDVLDVQTRGLGVAPAIAGQFPEIASVNGHLQQLYEHLIAPIADFLPTDPAETVILIPQGDLFLIPFAALLDEDGNALVDKHPLLFAPAIGLLNLEDAAPPRAMNKALVVGNPTMPDDPETGEPLSPLVGAEREALAVADMLNTTPLLREAATKAAVLDQLPTADVIHLATHGLLDDFSTGVPGMLALAPTADDAGYLTAAEILELPLTAQLAVLSACNTGQGTVTGDGIVGLSRSLLTAGVDSVAVTLWSIPDDPTALMMTAFYETLQTTPNRAIALQQAMLKTREQFPNPAHWSAFQLYGQTGETRSALTPRSQRYLKD